MSAVGHLKRQGKGEMLTGKGKSVALPRISLKRENNRQKSLLTLDKPHKVP